ncbi:MAG: Mor transcription activator family protein [Pseudomonadota bacterium]|nr:Mor transcription activator family protein [Pseudomonadota bacterium]
MTDCVQKDDLLFDLIDKTASVLEEAAGMSQDDARVAACAVARAVAKDWGGMQIYIPKGLSLRDVEIYSQFTGNNVPELCRRYGLTEVRIYQIIDKARKAHIARTQPDLFTE